MSNSFFDIPRENLISVFPEIIRNSDEHFCSANEIAKNGRPGTAISMLLISTEEMVKAFIIVLDARGFELRKTKGMDMFFRNHEIRFFIGWLVIVCSLFGEDIIDWLTKIKEDPKKILQQRTDYFNNPTKFDNWLKWYMLRKLVVIGREIHWFSQAEVFRQNGFYSDMQGNLITPLKITHKQYEEAQVRIEKVNKVLRHVVNAFLSEDSEMTKAVERVKTEFSEKKIYQRISNKLTEIRRGKKSIFDDLQEFFFEPLFDRNRRRRFKKFNENINKRQTGKNINNLG